MLASVIMSLPWVADGIEGDERRALQELAYIETLYGTESAPALADKPWITDGVDELAVSVMVRLRTLETYDEMSAENIVRMPFLDTLEPSDADTLEALEDLGRPLTWRGLLRAVVQKPWVGNGLDESEVVLLRHLGWITNGSEEAALRILGMPFLQTHQLGDGPLSTVSALWALGSSSQETLRAVAEKAWVEDGLDESETAFVEELGRWANRAAVATVQIAEKLEAPDIDALEPLAALAYRHHDLLRATMERPWAQDGLDEPEKEIVKYLNWTALGGEDVALWLAAFVHTVASDDVEPMAALWALGAWSQDALRAVLAKSWAEDGIDEAETVVVRNIGWLANGNEAGALQVLEMPILQTIEPADADAVAALQILGRRSHDGLLAVLGLPWVEDGIDEGEAEFVGALGWFAEQDEESALRVLESFSMKPPRAADAAAVSVLRRLAANHPELFRAVLAKPWVEDGLNEFETAIAQQLSWLAGRNEPAALQVLAMPFLQSIEPADGAAVTALRHMGSFKPENFQRVMAHSSLSGGVSDEWAKIITVVAASSDLDPDLIDVLLDPGA